MNTILKNFIFLTLGKYLAAGVGFVAAVLVGRTVGVAGFGNWAAAMAASTLCAAFLDLGFNRILVKEGAANLDRVDNHLFNILISKGALSVIVLAGAHFYAMREGWCSPMYKLILLLTLCKMADNFNMTFDKVFQIFQRMEFSAFILTGGRLTLLVAVYIGWLTEANLLFFAWTYFLISLSTAIVTVFLSNRKFARARPGPISLRQTLGRESIFFAISALVFQVTISFDLLVLREWTDDLTLGYYGVLQRIMWAFMMLPTLVEASILPVIFEIGRKRRQDLSGFYSAYLNRSLIIVQFPLLWAIFFPTSLVGIFGEEFLPAARWLPWLVPMLGLRFVMLAAGNVLTAVDRQWERTLWSLLWGATVLGLLFWLVPSHGIDACVLAVVGGHALITVIFLAAVRRLGYRLTAAPLLRTMSAGVVAALLLYFVSGMLPGKLAASLPGLFITLLITFVVVSGALLVTRATTAAELRSFIRPRGAESR